MCGAKPCSIFWTFLYFMSGLTMVGIGIWFAVDDVIYDTVVIAHPHVEDEPIVWRGTIGGLLAVGSYCFIIGIVGMAGAACDLDDKIKNSMIAYQVFASLGCVGILVFASFATAEYATTDEMARNETNHANLKTLYFFDETLDDVSHFTLAWNRYQTKYECCGLEGYWNYDGADNNNNEPVPWSCCQPKDSVDGDPSSEDDVNYDLCTTEADSANPSYDELYEEGCSTIHWDNFRRNQITLMALGWTSVFIQIVALIATGCLKKDAMD